MKSIVSEKGQITIPKAVRDTLGLAAGTTLEIRCENGKMIAEKRVAQDPVAKWRGRGTLPGDADVDAYLRRIRDGHRR